MGAVCLARGVFGFFALIVCCGRGALAFGEGQKYLIVSSPSTSRIAYLKLPVSGAPATFGQPMKTLISTGLTFPQGIAVDQHRRKLYVADPNLGKLVSYNIQHDRDGLAVDAMSTVAEGVEVRGVAVDGLGNVFFTEEPTQRIMRVTAQMMERGQTTAETVYDGSQVSAVNAPGGIALDNFFVYWLNKASGTQVGTLIRARQQPLGNASSPGDSVTALASNAVKCYGVCLALGNIFYTDEQNNVYGVSRLASARREAVTITSDLQEPRGCAFDGDGSLYVADKKQNAVYQFPSNMQQLAPQRVVSKAADLPGAFGVAVYVRMD